MKIASIDVGSNTVLLLIADVDIKTGAITPLANFYEIPRISSGLKRNGKISFDSIQSLKTVLEKYQSIINEFGCDQVVAKGTNALRIAGNSDEVIQIIKNDFRISIQTVTGDEEAYLTFLGATSHLKNTGINSCVLDIGGGSTEVIIGNRKDIFFRNSYNMGVVSLTLDFLHSPIPTINELNKLTEQVGAVFMTREIPMPALPANFIAVAGTPTTLAAICQNLSEYNENLVENFILTFEQIESIYHKMKKMSPKEILVHYGKIISGREDIILAGMIILMEFMKLMNISEIQVSTRGVRYGAIVDFLNKQT